LRKATRQGQKLSGHLESEKRDFVSCYKSVYSLMELLLDFLTSLLLTWMKHLCTLNLPLRLQSISEELKPFRYVIFKAVPGATIEKNLPSILPAGCVGTCELKGFMNTRSMHIWVKKILKPHIEDFPASLVLLDDYSPHKVATVSTEIEKLGGDLNIIPGGYTCVLQPLDVGINRPFKYHIKQLYNAWAVENLANANTVPVPNRALILKWINEAWGKISKETIIGTFKKIGYID
jgi:hypothetical protein